MIKLKPTNRQNIKKLFTENSGAHTIQGLKLRALYKLIQKKGIEIQTEDRPEFNKCKALKIGQGEYISIKHTPVIPGKFYPCKTDMLLLSEV